MSSRRRRPLGADELAEAIVPFDRELSIVAVRGSDGATAFYPLTENEHREGILAVSRAPARDAPQAAAEAIAAKLLDELDYVGVLAVELFDVGGELARERVRPARPQHRALDDRRRRDEPVREPPPRDPRASARLDRCPG